MKDEVVMIAAVADSGAIGRGGDLLAHVKGDLPRFKSLTMGHPVVMGRKTYESFPRRPLPGRLNIVVTRSADYPLQPGMVKASNIDQALEIAAAQQTGKTYIIGGGEIYRQAINRADRLEITRLHEAYPDADTFFPQVGAEWQVVSTQPNPGSEPASTFITLTRRSIP